jgi:hypothetical protein
LPAIQQTGLNDFCEPALQIPESFAGSKGVLGIVQDAPDGILYQVSRHGDQCIQHTADFSSVQQSTSWLALPPLHNLFAKTRLVRRHLSWLIPLYPASLHLHRLRQVRAQEHLLLAQPRAQNLHLQMQFMDTVGWECWLGLWWSDLQRFWLASYKELVPWQNDK